MSTALLGLCVSRLIIIILVVSVPIVIWAQNRFEIPKEARFTRISECAHVEDGKLTSRPCIIYTLPSEPQNEYIVFYDFTGYIVIEVIHYSQITGIQKQIWPK